MPLRLSIGRRIWLAVLLTAIVAGVSAGPYLAGAYCRHQARADLAAYRDESALGWLEAADRRDPENAETLFLLARACRRLSRFQPMNDALERALRTGLSPARADRERVLAVAQTERAAEVESRLLALLRSAEGDEVEICAAFSRGYYLSFDYPKALHVLNAWSGDFPDDPEPLSRAGDLWLALDEWTEAIGAYTRCLELAPRRTATRFSLAQALASQNQPRQAETHLRIVLAEKPDHVEALVGLAAVCLATDRADEARGRLQQALSLAPQHFEARRRLGEVELQSDRPREALEWIEPLAKHWPEDAALAKLKGQALIELGRSAEGQRHLETSARAEVELRRVEPLLAAVRENPEDAASRCELGKLLLKHQSREQGVGWLQSAVRIDPRNRAAHEALAEYYAKTGDVKVAEIHRSMAEAALASRRPDSP